MTQGTFPTRHSVSWDGERGPDSRDSIHVEQNHDNVVDAKGETLDYWNSHSPGPPGPSSGALPRL